MIGTSGSLYWGDGMESEKKLSSHQRLALAAATDAWVKNPRRLSQFVRAVFELDQHKEGTFFVLDDQSYAAAFDALENAGVDGVLSRPSRMVYIYEEELEAAVLALWNVVPFVIPFGQFGQSVVMSHTPDWANTAIDGVEYRCRFSRSFYIRKRR